MNNDIDYDALPDIAGTDGHDGSIWDTIDDIDYDIFKRLQPYSAATRPVYSGYYSPEFHRHYLRLWEPQFVILPGYYRAHYPLGACPYPPPHRLIYL